MEEPNRNTGEFALQPSEPLDGIFAVRKLTAHGTGSNGSDPLVEFGNYYKATTHMHTVTAHLALQMHQHVSEI
jgi:hypothetical protein